MLSSLSHSFKKNFRKKIETFILLSLILKRLSIEFFVIVQAMHNGEKSKVSSYSYNFEVKVGVHQDSVLSPLVFIIILEVLSREFRTSCPWQLLYANDLRLMA